MADPQRPTNTATPLVPSIPPPDPPDMSDLAGAQEVDDMPAGKAPAAIPGRAPPQPAAAKPNTAAKRPASASASGEMKTCNCRNSKCLKLYCECFASGRYCNGCNCANCMNNTANEAARSRAIENILERNPNAFRPKIQLQPGQHGANAPRITRHSKGCSCRKSHCLKKYCECFQAGIFCGNTCRCKDCRNFDGSAALAAVIDVNDASRSSLAVAAPDTKRAKVSARQSATVAHTSGMHYVPDRQDPARDAINSSRERKLHEVLAGMLTTLHSEALSKEKQRQREDAKNGDSAQHEQLLDGAGHASTKGQGDLSRYYVETEGILLGEFGSFLGKLADGIDEKVAKHPGA